jgi:broad specificity phosphatase PhoE
MKQEQGSSMSEHLYTRHGEATQERRSPKELVALQALPDEEFKSEILAMNMRQGLTEIGRKQAADLGKRIGGILLPEAAKIVALVGPYKRHQESAEIALSVPELSGRDIQVITDPRLAERNRGRLDASIWPARKLRGLPPEHPYANQYREKEEHPATWRPPQGENYADVNARIDAALAEHRVGQSHDPTIVFGSGEMSLARLRLDDEAYRRGTKTEDGAPVSLLTLNNGGVVELSDPNETGEHTHWQIHDPVETPRDVPYQPPEIIHSQVNELL